LALVKKRLTCGLHCDLRTWRSSWKSLNYTCKVLFLAFVTNRTIAITSSPGEFAFVQGGWHYKILQKIHWFTVFHISIWGNLEFCLGG